jgi:acyl-CoA thioesterase FadM
MPSFTTSLLVRIDDINYGGHMGNDKFLAFAQQARCEWLSSFGQTELQCFGVGLILVEAHVRYKAECFLGDSIKITATATDWTNRGFTLRYQFHNATRNKLAAEISTQMLAYDYQIKKITLVPEPLKQALG